MPRPSDVYATLGAPGVYQATPCTPSRLPNVYVFPPEEDNQDVYCLFHSDSASPSTFESFYNHPVYTQRDPNSPTFTDLRALDHALSYFERQSAAHDSARYGPGRSWEHEEQIHGTGTSHNYPLSTASSASSRSSLSDSRRGSSEIDAETNVYPNARHLVEAERRREEHWQSQSKPPSRRSSVFGDRPPDYAPESRTREKDLPALKKSQGTTLRSRAAMALKGLGNAMTRRPEAQAPPECGKHEGSDEGHESWFEPKQPRNKRSRPTLALLLGSHVDIHSVAGDVHLEVSPAHPSSSVRDPKLVKRKSMIQLFGLGRTSMNKMTGENSAYPRPGPGHPAAQSSSSIPSLVGESRLSKRKSVTQLLGLGRGASSTGLHDHTVVVVDTDDSCTDMSGSTRVDGSRPLDGSYSSSGTARVHAAIPNAELPGFPVSLATSGPAASPGRRKSFLSRRGFSFLDLHRHFATDHGSRPPSQKQHTPPSAPAIDPSAHFSPDSLSERTDSSSSAALSTECEQTVEDDVRFSKSHITAIVRQSSGPLVKDLEPNFLSTTQLDLNANVEDILLPSRFGLNAPDDDVDMEEDPPALELAVQLDSLNFDQLVFDPESFMSDDIYD